jgi:hypothetical protein
MHHAGRVLADQRRFQLANRAHNRVSATLQCRFTQPDQAVVRVNLEKDPTRFDDDRLKRRDLHAVQLARARLALDRAGGQPGDDETLGEDIEDDDGRHGDQGAGHHGANHVVVRAIEVRQTH